MHDSHCLPKVHASNQQSQIRTSGALGAWRLALCVKARCRASHVAQQSKSARHLRESGIEAFKVEAELCEHVLQARAPLWCAWQCAERRVEALESLHRRAILELALQATLHAPHTVFRGQLNL